MRKVLGSAILSALCGLFPSVAHGQEARLNAAAESQGKAYVFIDEGWLRVEVASLKRSGNKVELILTYENLSNEDRRMAIYNGGANGKDTMLIDSEGETWEMLKSYKGGSKGPAGKLFPSGMPMKVPVTFVKPTGKIDVESFTLISYIHILSAHGMTSDPHWVKVKLQNIPVGYGD